LRKSATLIEPDRLRPLFEHFAEVLLGAAADQLGGNRNWLMAI
jgi:hypothetical protein